MVWKFHLFQYTLPQAFRSFLLTAQRFRLAFLNRSLSLARGKGRQGGKCSLAVAGGNANSITYKEKLGWFLPVNNIKLYVNRCTYYKYKWEAS